jgi:hypothetical protein
LLAAETGLAKLANNKDTTRGMLRVLRIMAVLLTAIYDQARLFVP